MGSVSINQQKSPSVDSSTSSKSTKISSSKQRNIEFISSSQHKLESLHGNGSIFIDEQTNHIVCWSQTRSEVTVSIPFDSQMYPSKTISAQVIPSDVSSSTNFNTSENSMKRSSPILSYSNRHCAVGGNTSKDNSIISLDKGVLEVSAFKNNDSKSHRFLKGSLPHFIHGTREDEEEDNTTSSVEWEIINDGRYGNTETMIQYFASKVQKIHPFNIKASIKLIQITIRKAVPMYGMYIWWDQLVVHGPKIDVSNIKDRRLNSNRNPSNEKEMNTETSNSNTLSSVWEEAHAMFREKMKHNDSQKSRQII